MGKFKVIFSDKAGKDTDALSDDDFNRIVNGANGLKIIHSLTANISRSLRVMKISTA